MYTVGVAGHLIDATYNLMLLLTPFTLLFTGSLVLYEIRKDINTAFIKWIVITFAFTFLLEVAGVATGLIFGSYKYGDTLGLKLFEVPLIIGFNWTLVILGGMKSGMKLKLNKHLQVLLAAVFTVMFDYVLEPLAIRFDYWTWEGGAIPLQNYIAWFIISYISGYLYHFFKVKVESRVPLYYILFQLHFFIFINIGLKAGL